VKVQIVQLGISLNYLVLAGSKRIILKYNPIKIRIACHEEQITLDTASLFHLIILGIPWHKRYKSNINCFGNIMTFDSKYCHKNCHYYGKTVLLHQNPQICAISVLATGFLVLALFRLLFQYQFL